MKNFSENLSAHLEIVQYQELCDRYSCLSEDSILLLSDVLVIDCHSPAHVDQICAIAESLTETVYHLTGRLKIWVDFLDQRICVLEYRIESSSVVDPSPLMTTATLDRPAVASEFDQAQFETPQESIQLCPIDLLIAQLIGRTGQTEESIRASILLFSPRLYSLGGQTLISSDCVRPILRRWAETRADEIESVLHSEIPTQPTNNGAATPSVKKTATPPRKTGTAKKTPATKKPAAKKSPSLEPAE